VPLMTVLNYLALRHWNWVIRELRVDRKPHYLLLDSALALTVLAIVGLGTPMVLYVMASGLLAGLTYRAKPALLSSLLSTVAYGVLLITDSGYVPGARDFHTTVTLPALLLVAGAAGVALRRLLKEQERTATQLLRLRESSAIREERLRMARDLHDSLTKNLHGVWLLSRTLEQALDRGEPAPARSAARVIGETAQSLSSEARSVISGLRDQVQATRPLSEAVREVADRAVAGHPVTVEVCDQRCRPDLGPAAEVRHEVLAVVTEGVHNVLKHAEAQRVQILLQDSGNDLDLVIDDDGKGFAGDRIQDLPQQGHFGLAGMRERAARIGGRLSVQSVPGHGTTVRLTLPARTGSSRKPVPTGRVHGRLGRFDEMKRLVTRRV
jgi:signal transduction histidine kinase